VPVEGNWRLGRACPADFGEAVESRREGPPWSIFDMAIRIDLAATPFQGVPPREWLFIFRKWVVTEGIAVVGVCWSCRGTRRLCLFDGRRGLGFYSPFFRSWFDDNRF
jgi:hypothetical protein